MQLQILSIDYTQISISYYLHHIDKIPKYTYFLGHLPGTDG